MGLILNIRKSILIPTQKIEFTGAVRFHDIASVSADQPFSDNTSPLPQSVASDFHHSLDMSEAFGPHVLLQAGGPVCKAAPSPPLKNHSSEITISF